MGSHSNSAAVVAAAVGCRSKGIGNKIAVVVAVIEEVVVDVDVDVAGTFFCVLQSGERLGECPYWGQDRSQQE